MSQTLKIRFLTLIILALGIAAGAFSMPGQANFLLSKAGLSQIVPSVSYRLGLDLQGGTHLVYQADTSSIPESEAKESMEGLRDVIERRVNAFGVSEPVVQIEESGGDQRLIAELAGVRDINEAIRIIGETPYLEFRTQRLEEESNQILEAQAEGKRLEDDPFFVPTDLTGKYLDKASLTFDNVTAEPVVNLNFDEEGAQIFEDITGAHVGEQVAIYLDGRAISAPVVRQKITGGVAQITGNFTPNEGRLLVQRLNSGALPVPIVLISQQSVEASLGSVELERSLAAGMYGFLAVAIFMIFWYRLPGVVAVLALLMYVGILLSIFKLVPVTLTAAGVAGFILSVGMAVDANILIFERFKEEVQGGKSFGPALEEGFARAWTSIRDSNVSSLITATILYWFGTSLIKGFAVTLGLGILVSMFSAITITRTLLRVLNARGGGKLARLLYGV